MVKEIKSIVKYIRWKYKIAKLDREANLMIWYELMVGKEHPRLKSNTRNWIRLIKLRSSRGLGKSG